METVTVKKLAGIPPYEGPHAIDKIRFRPAGAALGVSAWGMNVLELDAGCDGYPEHDHQKDGQEEVYVVLRGAIDLVTAEGVTRLEEGDLVRVGPDLRRKLVTTDRDATVLAIGGTPGKAFASSLG
ncbi:MAG: hypothetical protein KC731_19455 [Myxococcales bacterium]|nr:hypothetical protein [Myxococcales bacterium]